MKLLIVTQAVDSTDSNLGFFHEWIAEFAKHSERVKVICLREGAHTLPANVRVYPLGKRGERSSFFDRLSYARRFLTLTWQLRGDYDAVFVHMNPEYLVLAGLIWRALGKPSALWYAHRSDNLKLRIAAALANYIFTVSDTSFALASSKVHAVGHGIDTARFTATTRAPGMALRLITVGRVSRSKHLLEMLPVLDELHARGVIFALTIIGAAITTADNDYERALRAEIAKRPYKDAVLFLGALSHRELPKHLADADVALNFATTGNMDKSGLEALLARLPLVTTNGAFRALPELPGLLICTNNPKEIADAIQKARLADVSQLAEVVAREHSLERLIPKILAILTQ